MSLTKRILAALLCTATMAMTFASCGGGTDTPANNDNADTTAAAEETTTAAETEPPEYVKPDVNYDGKTFIFSSLRQPNPNWVARHYVEADRPELNGDIINDAIYERIKATEEDTGVTIKSNIFENAGTMANTIMAGDHFTDLTLMAGNGVKTLLQQNMLTDLFSIDTLDLSKSWWDQNSVEQLSLGNKLYIAAGDISPFGILASHCTFVNKGMIRTYNLEDPYEAVRGGTWTYDKMVEMGKAVARDVDGDGVMTDSDTYGYSSEGIGMVTAGAAGTVFTTKDENDYPVLNINEDVAAAAVEKIVTAFRDPNICLYSGKVTGTYTNVFRQCIVQKFIEDTLMFVNNWLVVALDLRDMDSDFGILPPPKLNEAQETYNIYHSETWTTYAFVPKTAQDLDMVGNVMNVLGYYGHEHIYKALIETTITSKTLRDTDTEEMLDIIYNNRHFELAGIYNWGSISNMFNGFITGNDINFASKYAASKSAIETAIQATIDALE